MYVKNINGSIFRAGITREKERKNYTGDEKERNANKNITVRVPLVILDKQQLPDSTPVVDSKWNWQHVLHHSKKPHDVGFKLAGTGSIH